MKYSISKLRVNIKSLAAEAKIIRSEFRRTHFAGLDSHRRGRLREEARYAQLALAFTKGKPYNVVEGKTRNKPDPARLSQKLKRAGVFVNEHVVQNWLSNR